jgi:hypothetical protein
MYGTRTCVAVTATWLSHKEKMSNSSKPLKYRRFITTSAAHKLAQLLTTTSKMACVTVEPHENKAVHLLSQAVQLQQQSSTCVVGSVLMTLGIAGDPNPTAAHLHSSTTQQPLQRPDSACHIRSCMPHAATQP